MIWIANGPVTVSEVNPIGPPLAFEIVICCAGEAVLICWFPKSTLFGRIVSAGWVVPVPVRLTLCCPPAMFALTVNNPVRVPVADGLNVT